MKSLIWLILVVTCLSVAAIGQELTGTIVGTVRDTTGAVIPGATITVRDQQKGKAVVRVVTTDAEGEYNAPNILVGVYEISVEAKGFKRMVKTDVKIDIGQRRTVDITLEAGSVEEVVTVEADPIAVDLQSSTSGTIITGDQIRELSINNRNFVQLVTLAPGVSSNLADQVYVGTTNPEGQANTVQISVNGARASQNTFTIDGADITDRGSNLTIQAYPSVDSIGEFRVLRSLYPAESGRSGGGQVNVVTRSGTDKFRGTLFEFVRNEKFNANSFFNNQTAPFGRTPDGKAKRSPFRYNNFGWTLGGPVYFFNFGEKDPGEGLFTRYKKTYFFFSQEWRRDLRYPTLISTIPDANLRRGIFPIDICLQATGTSCTSVLPAGTPLTNINPVARQYLDFIYNKLPLPNSSTPYQLIAPAVNKSNFRQEILKIDFRPNNQISAFYRFQNDSIPTIDVNALFSSGSGIPNASTTSTNSPGRTHTVQFTYAPTATFIIEARYAYSYGAILSENIGLIARKNSPISVPLPYPVTVDRVPNITGNGFSSLVGFGNYDNFSDKHIWTGNLTWIVGKHTFKFGGVFSKYRKHENALGGTNNGAFTTFNTPGATTLVLATGVANTTLNQNLQRFANFLIGTNVTFTQSKFDLTADLRQRNFEAYAQDEWRLFRNLTLYYGVRYSFFGSPWDKNGFLSNFDPSVWRRSDAPLVTGAGNRVPGTGNFCNGLIINTQNIPSTLPPNCVPTPSPYGKYVIDVPRLNFAPRVGLAWDPFGKAKTSIRTGYGIYHEQILNGIFLQNIGVNPPYQETVSISGTRLDQPIPPGGSLPVVASAAAQTLRAVQPQFEVPYMQHWSLDIQQLLTKKTLLSVGYYGSKGTNLIGIVDINLLPPGYALTQLCATGSSTTPTVPCQNPGVPFTSSSQALILDQIRPYRGYRAINMIQPRFDSNYHSLQLSATHRFAGASQIQLAYTFSKNLTNNQTDRTTAPQNPYDIKSEWGRASLDRRHILTINYVYELPFYRDQKGLVGKILGGWQTSGIISYWTGIPFTAVASSYDPAGIGFLGTSASGPRPNQFGNPNRGGAKTQQQYFNTSAFQTTFPTSGVANVPGSAGRGTI
ncbi:MAG: TonB-dependent receptor, partial [Pyrinomonadaceae bacterium]|nr:TonB-dependent receptor [Pyrinomonadaceae bacterium]